MVLKRHDHAADSAPDATVDPVPGRGYPGLWARDPWPSLSGALQRAP